MTCCMEEVTRRVGHTARGPKEMEIYMFDALGLMASHFCGSTRTLWATGPGAGHRFTRPAYPRGSDRSTALYARIRGA